jgi:hypothetical protein
MHALLFYSEKEEEGVYIEWTNRMKAYIIRVYVSADWRGSHLGSIKFRLVVKTALHLYPLELPVELW